MKSFLTTCSLCLVSLVLSACATVKNSPQDPSDPYEAFNRQSYQFNEDLDTTFLKPVAEVYQKLLPWTVRAGVTNVFNNLAEIPTVANDLLQINPAQALHDTGRFAINSTIGVGGIFDTAKHMGLKPHSEDFGLTLARWGWTRSPYLVIPFLGPSTVRDAIGIPVDYYAFTIYPHLKSKVTYSLLALDGLNYRASLLSAEEVVDQAALDPYVFFRDAYFQRRQKMIQQNYARSTTTATSENHATSAEEEDVLSGIDTN
ncbi:MAG: VacJ family lipoprotein [Legionellales bacterium]|nr:VacJ family lipoprotein [Legionellales bacterium]